MSVSHSNGLSLPSLFEPATRHNITAVATSYVDDQPVYTMPSYAVLGATGQTGNAVLSVLLQSDKNHINAYCRSKSKLLSQFPEHATDDRLQIFEGSLSDTQLLANCCRGVRAVFLTVAVKGNEPGCRIAQDTAGRVIAAMERLRSETPSCSDKAELPRLIVLSSASTSAHLCRNMPRLAHALLYRANWNIYTDLEAAEALLRSQSSWLDTVYIKPGALSHDVQGGHVLSTEQQASPVSFLDVAAGMVECADEGEGRWTGREVSVLPKAEKVKFPVSKFRRKTFCRISAT